MIKMKQYFWNICFSAALFGSSMGNVHAVYNANTTGVVAAVWVYDGGNVAVRLSPMPVSGCPYNDFFYIPAPPELSDVAYKAMYARALAAHAMKDTITIGYDNTGGGCIWSRPRIHQIGSG